MLWPTSRWADIVCEGNLSDAVQYLFDLLAKCSLNSCLKAAEWPQVLRLVELLTKKLDVLDAKFMTALLQIGELKLLQNYFQSRKYKWCNSSETTDFFLVLDKCIATFGWQNIAADLVVACKGNNKDR